MWIVKSEADTHLIKQRRYQYSRSDWCIFIANISNNTGLMWLYAEDNKLNIYIKTTSSVVELLM